jgi:GT2 family glycosyltransferase
VSADDVRRVRANDWSSLEVLAPGLWTPRRSVSVVIPAFRADDTLPYTLAALSAQSYPSHLVEVVVVDDGNDPPVSLPELRPDNTRVVRTGSSWGRAHACHAGAAAAEGDVIHWLDADMVPLREQVENQMRWHHLLDHAVVVGHKTFVDPADLPDVIAVHDAVRAGTLGDLFAGRWTDEHTWVERIWRRTDDLTKAGFRAFHVHVGATASVGRELYAASGEMDPVLKLGEDVELGYRLAMKGAVFIADRDARSWHLGATTLMRRQSQVQRYNAPFVAERVPDFRKFRQKRGRMYRVPLIEVVVAVDNQPYEQVKYTVDGVLQAEPGDVRCVLVGGWSSLADDRCHPLDDPLLDLRLVKEEYASEARVVCTEQLVAATAFPAMFRLHLPAGWRPGETTMDHLTQDMQERAHGLRSVLLPDGQVVRLERTAAFERAGRSRDEGEDIDDVVDEIAGTWWSEGLEDGFVSPGQVEGSSASNGMPQGRRTPGTSQARTARSDATLPRSSAVRRWLGRLGTRRAPRRSR